jgi:hypothetical protein
MTDKRDTEPTPEERVEQAFIDTDEFRELFAAKDRANEAAERGDKEVALPAGLMARVLAITQPLDLEHLQAVWNRLCDEHGAPEKKIAPPPPIEYEEGKGPF